MRAVFQAAIGITLLSASTYVCAKPVDVPGKAASLPTPAGPANRKMSDSDRARQLTNDFAVCVLKTSPRSVERAVKLPAADSYNELEKLATGECLTSGALEIPRQLMRGAAFRALYIRDYRKQAPEPRLSAVDYLITASRDPYSQELARLNNFGSCVAVANPVAARSLVLANASTLDETAAIDALRPNFADCLPGGTTSKFTKGVLQGLLAEILYREANISTDPMQVSN